MRARRIEAITIERFGKFNFDTRVINDSQRAAIASHLAESGSPEFNALGWFGVFGPAGLPPKVLEMLNRAVTDTLRDPAVVERLVKIGRKALSSV